MKGEGKSSNKLSKFAKVKIKRIEDESDKEWNLMEPVKTKTKDKEKDYFIASLCQKQ